MNYLEAFFTMQNFNYHKQFDKSKIIYEKYYGLINKEDIYLQNKFLNEYELACKKYILKSKPTNIQLVLFNKCNSNCIMCNQTKERYVLSNKYIKEITDEYLQYLDILLWQGGEVFLYDKFIDIVKQISKYKRINQQIITNAQIFSSDIIKEITSIPNIKLIISVDGVRKETYEKIRIGSDFNKLIKNIELLNKYKQKYKSNITTNINFVILKENCKEILEIVAFAKKYDFCSITFNECIATKKYAPKFTKEEKEYINKQLQMAIAYATKNNIRITIQYANNKLSKQSKENILVCKMPFNKLLLENGNLFAPECTCLKKQNYVKKEYLNIEKIWNSKLMQSYRKHILGIKNNMEICNSNCRLYKHFYN